MHFIPLRFIFRCRRSWDIWKAIDYPYCLIKTLKRNEIIFYRGLAIVRNKWWNNSVYCTRMKWVFVGFSLHSPPCTLFFYCRELDKLVARREKKKSLKKLWWTLNISLAYFEMWLMVNWRHCGCDESFMKRLMELKLNFYFSFFRWSLKIIKILQLSVKKLFIFIPCYLQSLLLEKKIRKIFHLI